MMSEAGAKKINKVSKIVGIISTIFLVLCVSVLLYTTISYSKTGLVKFFGYSYHIIQSNSMEPEINVGDLVIVKKVPYDQIEVGDDILFKCEDPSPDYAPIYGKYVVHKVVDIVDAENGIYKTRGVHNLKDDDMPSKAEGKVVRVSSSLSGLFTFLTQGRNIIFIIGIAGVVIFTFLQLCTIIANSAKIKSEKDKQKLSEDQELKDKIKKELEEELVKNNENNDKNAKNLTQNEQKLDNSVKNIEEQDSKPADESPVENKKETGGDNKWNIH